MKNLEEIEFDPAKHLHIYVRSSTNRNIYRCTHPDCSHYHQKAFLLGKRASCYFCHDPFILSKEQLRNKIPRCDFCKKGSKLKKVESNLEELISNLTQENEDAN